MRRMELRGLALLLIVTLVAAGCATKKYVRTEVDEAEGRVGDRVDEVVDQVEANQERLAAQQAQLESLSGTTREAFERAVAAGKLAEGKFLYETVLSDDQVRFGFESSELSEAAKTALDTFAEELRARNENVFIEIQGHTDASGPEDHNLKLGHMRAEAVQRYLNLRHGLALHRLATVSYGEEEPVADNGTREGRSRNRRVVLVVLK